MIYFIRDATSDLVKVGFSEKPWGRFGQIQVHCPHKLDMLAIAPGDMAEEGRLHRLFAPVRHRGEWFRLSGPITVYIATAKARDEIETDWSHTKKIPQIAIAECLGVSKGYVSKIMAGKRIGTIEMAAKVFSQTGARLPMVSHASDDDMAVLVRLFGDAA